MRILFICPTFLLPINTGMRVRFYNIMKVLHEQGHQLGLISAIHEDEIKLADDLPPWFTDTAFSVIRRQNAPLNPKNWLHFKRLLRVLLLLASGAPKQYALAYKPELEAAVNKLIETYDIVCVELYSMSANISERIFRRHGHKLILVEHDIAYMPSLRAYQLAAGLKRLRLWWTYVRTRRTEERLLKRYAQVVVMSEPDRERIAGLRDGKPVYVVPNGVDTRATPFQERPEAHGPPSLLFVGGFDHAPNLDAIKIFIKEYMPLLRKHFPGITFNIAGRHDNHDLTGLAAGDVNFLGFVQDLTPLYQQATAALAILRFGGGTKLKTLYAMAIGTPLIASDIGVEGLRLTPGVDFLKAQHPEEALQAVRLLVDHPETAQAIALAARKLCVERYDWKNIALYFEGLLAAIVKDNNSYAAHGNSPEAK